MDPLTLALIMGGGAAIKGIGQGIAGFQQAEGMMSDYEKQQMKKLQREQELGLLGFDDAEMADMRQAVINPVKALQTQQQDQLKATMAGMDAGAGSTFRAALVANEQAQQMQAAAEDKLQQLNLKEKQREEQLLMGLNRQAAAQEAAKKAAITQAVTLGIGGAAETAGQGLLLAEETSIGTGQADTALQDAQTMQEAMLLMKLLSGGGMN